MKVFNSDRWYEKYQKHILLAQAFTGVKQLNFIIKGCRLKPFQVITRKKGKELVLHKHWVDEYGNSLKIENKRIKIYYNDLSLSQENIICTDMYYGLSIDKIAKISKLLYVFDGKEDINNENCIYLSFLGIDNYLRCYIFLDQEWKIISPLYLGMHHLKCIADHADIKFFTEVKNNKFPYPCQVGKTWITSLPMSFQMRNELEKNNNLITSVLERKNNN